MPRSLPFFDTPVVRRVGWHVRRMVGQLDRRFFLSLAQGIVGFVLVAASVLAGAGVVATFACLGAWALAGVPGALRRRSA